MKLGFHVFGWDETQNWFIFIFLYKNKLKNIDYLIRFEIIISVAYNNKYAVLTV